MLKNLHHDMFPEPEYYQLADMCQPCVPCDPYPVDTVPSKKKDTNPMRYDSVTVAPAINIEAKAAPDADAVKRKYLNDRLYMVRGNFRNAMQDKFNYYGSAAPKTYKQLIEKITKGEFKLDEKRTKKIDFYVEDNDWYGNSFDGIIWTGEGAPDRDGYNAVIELFEVEYKKTQDTVAIGTPAEGLAAIQALEAWTPPAVAN